MKYNLIKTIGVSIALCWLFILLPVQGNAQCVSGITVNPNPPRLFYPGGRLDFTVLFVNTSQKLSPNDITSFNLQIADCNGGYAYTTTQHNVDYVNNIIWVDFPPTSCYQNVVHNVSIKIKPAGCTTEFSWSSTIRQLANPNPLVPQYDFTPVSNAGLIGNDQTIVLNTQPAKLISLSGGVCDVGAISYQWEQSSNNNNWSLILGANEKDYLPNVLLSTTYFRRRAWNAYYELDPNQDSPTNYSNTIRIKVNPAIIHDTVDNFILARTPYAAYSSLNSDTLRTLTNKVYYDGLGRPKQEVVIKQSPGKKDVVRPIAYNIFGREEKTYLPYERNGITGEYTKTSTAIAQQKTFYQSNYPVADAPYALTQKRFETSPLNRVVEETLPGNDYQMGSSHTIKYWYYSNGINEIKQWKVDAATGALSQSANYPVARLQLTETADEDGMKTREFKNKHGNVVERWQVDKANASNRLKTAYAYDYYGKLRAVVPPKAYDMGVTTTEFKSLLFLYSYDNRGRMIEKTIPDKATEYMVYDKIDRLVMAQDGEMRAKAKWKVLLYDKLNRPVAEALIACTKTRAELETAFANAAFSQTRAGSNNYYTHTNITLTGVPAITANDVIKYMFYDNWKWTGATPVAYNETVAGTAVTVAADRMSGTAKGQVTGSRIKAYDNNELTASAKWLTGITQYDKKYRAIQAVGDLYDGTTGTTSKGVISSRYHFDGAVERTREEQTFNSVKNTVDVRFEYDHARRPVKVWNKINSQTEQLLATTAYDALGKAKTKTLGNGEAVTYAYNIRDWLSGITSMAYSSSLNFSYNGNIASINDEQYGPVRYLYDGFGRLTKGEKVMNEGLFPREDNITYDANGNLLSLRREGSTSYVYTYSGNRLSTLKKNTTSYAYTYDTNGNVTTDGLRGFAISYNLLNLPNKVSKGTDNIEYIYDANGNKLAKKKNGAFAQFYAGSIVYKGDKTAEYIVHGEGLALKSGTAFAYQYNLTDHLGNVRRVLDASKNVLQSTDYYPFGLPRGTVAGLDKNKYLYNGKEIQDDVLSGTAFNVFDYGARLYDAEIGRWDKPDPLAEKNRRFSSYAYCYNNPLRFVDPDGMTGWDVIMGVLRGACDNIFGTKTRAGYAPANPQDYNDALTITDMASMAVSVIMVGEGATMTGGGVAAAPVTGGVSLGVSVAGLGITAAGTVIGANAANNLQKGNNYGFEEGNGNSGNSNKGSSQSDGQKQRNKPKEEGTPNSSEIQSKSADGKTTKYTTYDKDGKMIKEYRGEGKEHGNIPRPNVKEPKYNVNPKTGERFQNGYEVRKAQLDEIP